MSDETMKILFVCTGNICRSPMAEGMMKARIPRDRAGRWHISSAGTFAWEDQAASALAVDVLAERGIDISGHRARQLTAGLIEDADLVVAIAHEHKAEALRLVPDAKSSVLVLGSLDKSRRYDDIDDPIGGDRAVYARIRDELSGLIDLFITYLSEKYKLAE
jgi:protein-tyrosine-phosphatase